MGNRDLSEGYDGHLFNDASLQSALAHEITSPTVLLRQLSLMVAETIKNITVIGRGCVQLNDELGCGDEKCLKVIEK
jgi:hypothetical protein